MTTWANITLFIWLLMTAPKVPFKLINLINQNVRLRNPGCWQPGTKIEFIKIVDAGTHIPVGVLLPPSLPGFMRKNGKECRQLMLLGAKESDPALSRDTGNQRHVHMNLHY
jgi:hypothetical protein